jgi:hypothetical protein
MEIYNELHNHLPLNFNLLVHSLKFSTYLSKQFEFVFNSYFHGYDFDFTFSKRLVSLVQFLGLFNHKGFSLGLGHKTLNP